MPDVVVQWWVWLLTGVLALWALGVVAWTARGLSRQIRRLGRELWTRWK